MVGGTGSLVSGAPNQNTHHVQAQNTHNRAVACPRWGTAITASLSQVLRWPATEATPLDRGAACIPPLHLPSVSPPNLNNGAHNL